MAVHPVTPGARFRPPSAMGTRRTAWSCRRCCGLRTCARRWGSRSGSPRSWRAGGGRGKRARLTTMESKTLDAGTMQGLIGYSPNRLVYGKMTLKHRQSNGTHYLRLTVGDGTGRDPIDDEVEVIVNAVKGLGFAEPGRHMRFDAETGEQLVLLSWPVGEQPKLF